MSSNKPPPLFGTAGPARPDAFAQASARLGAQRPLRDTRLQRVATAIQSNLLPLAEKDLAAHLAAHPDDPDALNLQARLSVRQGRVAEAMLQLERCLARAPGFTAARYNLASLLFQAHRYAQAWQETEALLGGEPSNPLFLLLKANILESVGDGESALAICRQLVAESPNQVDAWVRCGHAHRATGRQQDSIAAYRRAIALRPSYGAAWWSLANLKTARLADADVAAMEGQLKRSDLPADDRIPLQFALAKALEDRGTYERAFALYEAGNGAMRLRIDYDPDTLSAGVARNKAVFTPAFFQARAGASCPSAAPIFILGRPRSGSTLVEQILASHSAIEGTAELPYITALAERLDPHPGPAYGTGYLDALAAMSSAELATLGETYLHSAEVHRRLGRAHFIDKKPANFAHIGMIHLMLPNSKIVDVRRHPAGCCLSMFKSYSSKGRLSLPELGRSYRDHVELMAHFDAVLPGRIHRVIYEELVADPEAEVRRLLAYLGLPFEPACLRFHETERTMLTPSSEQVRQPISREAVDHWRHFEPWLGGLIDSLGTVHAEYPAVPAELR
ncbi:MAG: sulfotransferase [Ramlibacter sp.]|nr:sulfotransferase [Ramlibacter sp.]